MLYNVKMRASCKKRCQTNGETVENDVHISGAERLVAQEEVADLTHDCILRAQRHSKGTPDTIHLRVTAVDPATCLHVPALPVSSLQFSSKEAGFQKALALLAELGITNGPRIRSLLQQCRGMRGAMLVCATTYERLEPDQARGVRATSMDYVREPGQRASIAAKQHFAEALVLASKVAAAPGVCAELCVSDDPDYVTGYVAARHLGYVRLTPLKEAGDTRGGRIFFFRGTADELERCIVFLEQQPVLIDNMPPLLQEEPPLTPPDLVFTERLKELAAAHLQRHCVEVLSPSAAHIIDATKKTALNLASNDYLGLANDPRVRAAAQEAIEQYGFGTGGSRLTTGTRPVHRDLEQALATWKGKEAGLVFATGYMANCGTLQALCGKNDVILSDEKNHASIIDGCRLSGAKIVVYAHNDMADLAAKAERYRGHKGVIVSDAVFSMDGDILHFPEFLEIAKHYGFLSMIDEAHASGVLGKRGTGIQEYFGLTKDGADITLGTLSKALGSEGGFVVGSTALIAYLQNTARSFIFSTAPSVASMAAAHMALNILEDEPERVARLHENIRTFTACFPKPPQAETPILPFILGSEERALRCAQELAARACHLHAIRYPTVAKNTARLRVSLRSDHATRDLQWAAAQLLEVFAQIP